MPNEQPCFDRTLQIGYPKDDAGKPLCRWCKGPVKPPRRTFCSDACVHEFRLRTDTGYVRDQVFKRDKGVCAKCGTDTEKLRESVTIIAWDRQHREPRKGLRESRDEFLWRHSIWSRQRSIAFSAAMKEAGRLYADGWPSPKRSWWEADHIVEVRDGGGGCGLENYQTLCVPCHKDKTLRRTCTSV